MNTEEKIQAFADLLSKHTQEAYERRGSLWEGAERNWLVHIRPGRKYTKVDLGDSGKYMVENATEKIYGIKGYGTIHRGHYYGTLDAIQEWQWGDYTAHKTA